MSGLKGDFVGFRYNGVHSSQLGIIRTSNGSRFDENLLPTLQDKTIQIPGNEGSHYFGSYYTQRQFNVSFAFDSLTESQLEFLKVHLGDKKPHPLVFDEVPYKTYMARVTGTATIKHIPFLEKGRRVYKGEGSIQFTCSQPYAICEKKFYDDDYYQITGRSEWLYASGLKSKDEGYDIFYPTQQGFRVYNPGAIGADWILTVPLVDGEFPQGEIQCGTGYLSFSGGAKKGSDTKITFNSKTGLVEGWSNGKRSGKIYNDYITAGDFFKIPITNLRTPWTDNGDENHGWTGQFKDGDNTIDYTYFKLGSELATAHGNIQLAYNYYYL